MNMISLAQPLFAAGAIVMNADKEYNGKVLNLPKREVARIMRDYEIPGDVDVLTDLVKQFLESRR